MKYAIRICNMQYYVCIYAIVQFLFNEYLEESPNCVNVVNNLFDSTTGIYGC